LFATAQLLSLPAAAQEKKEKEEIIIRKKGGKTQKTTIVIDGDKVTINGKPVEKGDKNVMIEKFEDGDHPVIVRVPRVRVTPKVYRYYNRDNNNGKEKADDLVREYRLATERDAFLGVVTEESDKGAVIEEVVNESAAEKAGLQKGDIITSVDGKTVKNTGDIAEVIADKKPGDEVDVVYLRDGKEKKVKAKLGENKNRYKAFNYNFDFDHNMGDMYRGFRDMERELGNMHRNFRFEPMEPFHFDNGQFGHGFSWSSKPKMGITIQDTEEGNGVTILEVDTDSPAAKSGLQKDDLVTEINGKKITGVSSAREAMREENEKNLWNFKVLRGGKTVNVEVKIPKPLKKADL
jgi:serine protease Do